MKIASELLVERLADWGVDTVFGLPGDGINGIMEGLRRHQDRVRFVLVQHEEAAAFMATGYAKATGRIGVCLATSGPGAIHLLNGLYDARLDHVPVLAITGMQATSLLGTQFQQEVHLEHLFADVAEYNAFVHVPVQIPALVDNAVRTSVARRTVSHLTFPVDLQEADADLKPYEGGLGTGRTPATDAVLLAPRVVPAEADLQRAADVLNGAETRAGARIPTEVPLVGDAAATLRELIPLLRPKDDRTFLERTQQAMSGWREEMVALESAEREPIQPQYLARVIDRVAADDAILCTDSGTIATWAARHFDIRGERMFMLSSNLATMAPALPYALASQWAYPGRQCIAFVGDGGFPMLMAELLTAVRSALPVKVVICNNGVLGQILWEQMALGYPEHGVRFQEPAQFAPWATACGAYGARVEKPGDIEPALRDAFAFDGPALVDVVVNADEPPMPAKVTYQQAKGFAEAFLKGQPRRASIASTLFRDKLDRMRS